MLGRVTRSKTRPEIKKLHSFAPGSYVWAKMDGKFWPGIIVSHNDMGFNPPSNGKLWIFWFGDHRVSEVRHSLMKDFCEEYKSNFTPSHRRLMPRDWVMGVFEALREIGLPETKTLTKIELVYWAKCNLSDAYLKKYVITDFIREKLAAIRNMNVKPPPDARKSPPNPDIINIIENYKLGMISTLHFCLGCYNDNISQEHPVFFGYFCVDCKERFKKNFFKTDENAKNKFCVICACAGTMIVCKEDECKFVYCIQCIQDLAETNAYEILSNKEIWFCFVCYENRKYRGVLSLKFSWKDNIDNLFAKEKKSLSPIKSKNRTSSLNIYSNINPLLGEIEKIKNKIGVYYLQGSNDDIINITEENYPDMLNLFKSNHQLKENERHKMLPVDIFTCNKRDINENRLESPTVILYEFYRVLKNLEMFNSSLLWLYVWDADISLQQKVIVTRLLQSDPVLIENTISMKKQLIWSNIPFDITSTELSQKNILFTDPCCYQH